LPSPHSFIPALYPRGTLCAAVGLIVIAVYYEHVWRRLKNCAPYVAPYAAVNTSIPTTHRFVELRYLYWGMAISIMSFLLAGTADMPPTPLDQLVGALMGLCGAIFAVMFAVGLIALWNLWREAIFQLKCALNSKRLLRSKEITKDITKDIRTGSFLRAIPRAILWLFLGFAIIFGVGALLIKPLAYFGGIYRELMFLLFAAMFGGLWRSTSHSAIVLRLILLSLFTAIIIPAAFFFLAWTASQIAPLLVILLATITTLNALFYARWVRQKALINNFE
jgi:MFS family permease